jgi:Rod binding domain-containing protein
VSVLDGIATVPLLPAAADDGGLDALRRLPQNEAAKKKAAGEMQALFLTQLLRAMRKTIPENDLLPKSAARKTYEDSFDETVARTLAQGDPLGMVRTLGSEAVHPPRGPQVPDGKSR